MLFRSGDRVALVLPQRFETAAAYMGILQMGAVAMPLSLLFGPDALSYRLIDSAAVAAIVDEQSVRHLLEVRAQCPSLHTLVGIDGAAAACDVAWPQALLSQRPPRRVQTLAEDPAVLIYTSGTTGPPKGALIPHRALIGNLKIGRAHV